MGRQIILSEEEKRNIQKMYGLINEQPIPPNSSNVARAVSTIANGGKASDAAKKTLNSSKNTKLNTKFEQLKGNYYHDSIETPRGWLKFIGQNVSNEESGTNYIIDSLHPFNYKGGDVAGLVLYLTNDQKDYVWMYYMCETEKWYSSTGQELMSDFNEEFYNIGNKTKNEFCKFQKRSH